MQTKGESQTGRRNRIAKGGQRLPLFMSAGRSRVSERVAMSAATSREKQRYLRWASEAAGVSRDEAEVMMLDRAIGDYMKKDEGWQLEKAAGGGADQVDGAYEPAGQPPRPVVPADGGAKITNPAAPGAVK